MSSGTVAVINFNSLTKFIVPIANHHVAQEENEEEESLEAVTMEARPCGGLTLSPVALAPPVVAKPPNVPAPVPKPPPQRTTAKGCITFGSAFEIGSPVSAKKRKDKRSQVAPAKLLLDFTKFQKSNETTVSAVNKDDQPRAGQTAQSVVLNIDDFIAKMAIPGAKNLSLTKKSYQ
jgi:hypothetical protein